MQTTTQGQWQIPVGRMTSYESQQEETHLASQHAFTAPAGRRVPALASNAARTDKYSLVHPASLPWTFAQNNRSQLPPFSL